MLVDGELDERRQRSRSGFITEALQARDNIRRPQCSLQDGNMVDGAGE